MIKQHCEVKASNAVDSSNTRNILASSHLEAIPPQSCHRGPPGYILHKTGLLTASREQGRTFTKNNQVKWFLQLKITMFKTLKICCQKI